MSPGFTGIIDVDVIRENCTKTFVIRIYLTKDQSPPSNLVVFS